VTGREWKPGDVALRTSHNADPYAMRSMAALTCSGVGHDRGLHWHHENGGWDPMEGKPSYRPLVVIDPEDREQVERLAEALNESLDFRDGSLLAGAIEAALADTLHALANPTPPKPAEPVGLGAVVEDAKGVKWVRLGGLGAMWIAPELSPKYAVPVTRDQYAGIDTVRVLSEGVTA